jgi:hypothetical protein
MIQIHVFKEKGREGNKGRPQLGGQWKVPSLVVFGRKRKSIFHLLPLFTP